MADQKWYDEGLRPRVLINWQTFVDRGIPTNWQGPFTDAVLNAYTRWMNVAGVDLRFQFYGYTTKTNSDSGELVISMNDFHPGESRLASTFGSYNQLIIVFHRGNGGDPNHSPWPFVPYNANPGEFDIQAILMHELGHCHGLDHSSGANDTMNGGYEYHRYRFGPFDNDINRLRNIYSAFTRNRLRQLRSTSSGNNWSDAPNDLTSNGSVDARTNLNAGVIAAPQSGLYLVGWSNIGNAPSWLRGDGEKFLFRHWLFYGGERSIYGPAYARNDDHTLLWAWVTNDDSGSIKIVRSLNQGYQWHWVNVPTGARTFGTPGLCWTRSGGQSIWILVWAHFDRADHSNTGYLRASISVDDGNSWSAPIVLNNFYKALSGVTAAADSNNHIEVAFAWAPNSVYGMNIIRTFICSVVGGQLQHNSIIFGNDGTRIQPALTFDSGTDKFILAWREQNFNTSVNVVSRNRTSMSWSSLVRPGPSTQAAPALCFSPEYGEAVLWYVNE
jgi:hypothetical protein